MNGFWVWNLILENLVVVVFPTDAKRLELNFTAVDNRRWNTSSSRVCVCVCFTKAGMQQ